MSQLRFKLVDNVTSTASLAAIYSTAGQGSYSLKLEPGVAAKLRAAQSYNASSGESDYGHFEFGNNQPASGYYSLPFPWPVPNSDSYDDVKSDMLVGPRDQNVCWVISEPNGTHIKCGDISNIRVNNLRTGGYLPITETQYRGTQEDLWDSTPLNTTSGQYVRLVMGADQVVDAVPMASFTEYVVEDSSLVDRQRLFQPIPTFTDWSLENVEGTCVMKVEENYVDEFSISGQLRDITWQNDPFNLIEVRVPRRNWYQPWFAQVKKASEFFKGTFISTEDINQSPRPPLVVDEVPSFVNRSLLALCQGNVNILGNGNDIIDLEGDGNWAAGIVLKINGVKRNDLIKDVLEETGHVLLRRPIGRASRVTTSYAVDPDSWVEISSVDLNPRPNHLKPQWMDGFTIKDSTLTLYVQSGETGQLLIGASIKPGSLYYYDADSGDPSDYLQEDKHISIAKIFIPQNSKPILIDVRQQGGGLRPEDQLQNHLYDIKSHTKLGFYYGYPIKGNAVIITLPQLLFESFYRRFLDKKVNTVDNKTDTSNRPLEVFALTEEPYLDYSQYNWVRRTWTTQPFTVTITKEGTNHIALDTTDYSNRTQLPTLDPYANTEEYLFYYRDGKIYINNSDYDSLAVDYTYLSEEEEIIEDAYVTTRNFIAEAISRMFPAGTYLVLRYEEEKDFGPQAKARMQQYVYTTDDSGNLIDVGKI